MSPSVGDGDTATRQIHQQGANANYVVGLINPILELFKALTSTFLPLTKFEQLDMIRGTTSTKVRSTSSLVRVIRPFQTPCSRSLSQSYIRRSIFPRNVEWTFQLTLPNLMMDDAWVPSNLRLVFFSNSPKISWIYASSPNWLPSNLAPSMCCAARSTNTLPACTHSLAQTSSRMSFGVISLHSYKVESTVDPPASTTANTTPLRSHWEDWV